MTKYKKYLVPQRAPISTWCRGIEQGIEQGQRILLENLLLARFSTLDSELLNIIPSMLARPTEEYTPLLLQLSREELINRFS